MLDALKKFLLRSKKNEKSDALVFSLMLAAGAVALAAAFVLTLEKFHLYEVLHFFGVKNLGAPSGKPFVSFKEVEPNEGDLGDYDVGPGKKYKDLADKISHQFGIPNHKRTEF